MIRPAVVVLALFASSTFAALIPDSEVDENDFRDFVEVCGNSHGSLSVAPASSFISKLSDGNIFVDAVPELAFKCKTKTSDGEVSNVTFSLAAAYKGSKMLSDDDAVLRTLHTNRLRNVNPINSVLDAVECASKLTTFCSLSVTVINQGIVNCLSNGTVSCYAEELLRQIHVERDPSTSFFSSSGSGFEPSYEFFMANDGEWISCQHEGPPETVQSLDNSNTSFYCPAVGIDDHTSCQHLIRVRRTVKSQDEVSLPAFADDFPAKPPQDSYFHACVMASSNGTSTLVWTVVVTVLVCFGVALATFLVYRRFRKKKKQSSLPTLHYNKDSTIYHPQTGLPMSESSACTQCTNISGLSDVSTPGYCKHHLPDNVMTHENFVDIMARLNHSEQESFGVNRKFALLQRQLSGDPSKLNMKKPLNCQADLLEYDPKLEIDRENFTVGKLLGKGNFGCVWEGTATGLFKPDSRTKVAIKSPRNTLDFEHVNVLLCEMKILCSMDSMHLNLVNLLGSCTTKICESGDLWILLEYCQFGDLKQYLIDHHQDFVGPDASQNSRLLLKWAHNVAKGMEYLARRHIMHGDLAARNVLIGDNLVAKVSDFGLSKTFYDNIQYSKKERTEVPIKWMALEYLRYHNFTVTSDVWSYGVVFWEIFSLGEDPYPGIDWKDLKADLEKGERLSCPEVVPADWFTEAVYDQVTKPCWIADPMNRSSFSSVVKQVESLLTDEELKEYHRLEQVYQRSGQLIMHDVNRSKHLHPQPGYTKVAVVNADGSLPLKPVQIADEEQCVPSEPCQDNERPPSSPLRAPTGYAALSTVLQEQANGALPNGGYLALTSVMGEPPSNTGYATLSSVLHNQETTYNEKNRAPNGYVVSANKEENHISNSPTKPVGYVFAMANSSAL